MDQPRRRAHRGRDVADGRGGQALARPRRPTRRPRWPRVARPAASGFGSRPQGRTQLRKRPIADIVRRPTDTRRGPPRHDPDDPVPRAHERAQRDPALEPLVQPPRGGPLPAERQGRVLRGAQRRRPLRLQPALQVPHHRPRRRRRSWAASWPATSGPARPVTRSTRAGWTIAASSSRTASSSAPGTEEYLLTSAEPNFAYFADQIGRLDVQIEEVSHDIGTLALQGPRSRATCSSGSSRRWSTSRTSGSPRARSAARP